MKTTDTYLYDAFGSLLASSGSSVNPFRYGGKVGYYRIADGSLLTAGFRELAPGLGRWLSRDPLRRIFVAEGARPSATMFAIGQFPQGNMNDWTVLQELSELSGGEDYLYCSNQPITCFDPSGLMWPVVSIRVVQVIVGGIILVIIIIKLEPFLISWLEDRRRRKKGKKPQGDGQVSIGRVGRMAPEATIGPRQYDYPFPTPWRGSLPPRSYCPPPQGPPPAVGPAPPPPAPPPGR